MINISDRRIAIISDKTFSGKTRQMLHILEYAIQHQVPTLFISLELTTEQVINQVQLNEIVSVVHNSYVEDICNKAKSLKDIKLILIDSLIELNTRQMLCMGTSDIRFHILKQLKQLADELSISIIVTGPANVESEIKNINELDIEIVNLNSI